MLLAAIIILFSLLALGLLALLDRYDASLMKAPVDRRSKTPTNSHYYDAFGDRRKNTSRNAQSRT
jgi:hypothetical protein